MYYWKQTNWNEYTLIGEHTTWVFKTYGCLYNFCVNNRINATQV